MPALLDTDVIVDCLRGLQAARQWLDENADEAFQVPGVDAMELVVGCRDRRELDECRRFLKSFDIAWTGAAEFARAFELLSTHRLASGIGIPDCVIAASALARPARLYSFNLRHFRVIPGLDVRQPYERAKQPGA